jgi:hypothetical protein
MEDTNMKRNLGMALSVLVAAVGIAVLSAEHAHATQVRRIEQAPGQVTWFDTGVTGWHSGPVGQLEATMTLNGNSRLDILIQTSAEYNERLSTRCSDGRLLETAWFLQTNRLSIEHSCGLNVAIRCEGAIDDW